MVWVKKSRPGTLNGASQQMFKRQEKAGNKK
ncbi:hypothetical protein SAMN04488132_10589 [Sediminibacterium ginsengisoli]|uniref:Uncharacterized protein n=1 Tax=Sediminibacterium ginsengisoli TaxID=413434 RepID=A0A1T4P1D8_9BACT|nr:hypothetical protein SAMN04488132_10589 [Sediminibacterium ginsengisoli]